jgi:hypothetical protein
LRGAVELISRAELKSGARRGCGEQALVIPGIAMSVDVDIHLFVIHGAYVFDAATIVLVTFAFLLVFVFAVVGVLFWLFPPSCSSSPPSRCIITTVVLVRYGAKPSAMAFIICEQMSRSIVWKSRVRTELS